MPGIQSDETPPRRATLSDNDIVRIQAATFLTLCAALDHGGTASLDELSGLLLCQVEEMDEGAWTVVLRGLAGVLQRDARRAEPQPPAPKGPPALRVVEGGRRPSRAIGLAGRPG
jgi:hypothetical protein